LIEFPIARCGRQAVKLFHAAEICFIRVSGINMVYTIICV